MHDLVITNGLLVDGTGAPPRRADLLIDGARITSVSEPGQAPEGRRQIDAAGCIVTPGFIDPHTHFDAQLFWDGAATPSAYHGVTSVAIGNCGFGVAPCAPGAEEYLLRSLEAVEEIPYDSTRRGVPFGWRSWPEYFDRLGELELGVNVGGYVPHSLLRAAASAATAAAATTKGSTEELVEREVADLAEALEAGALGLSSSRGGNHLDADGNPMPSRLADDDELARLVATVGDRVWQINLQSKGAGDLAGARRLMAEVERYAAMTRPGGRLSWTPFVVQPGDDVAWRAILAHNRHLNETHQIAPQVSAQPMAGAIIFTGPSTAAMIEGWAPAWAGYAGLDQAARRDRLADPAFRSVLRDAPADCRRMMAPCYDRWAVAVSPSRPEVAGLTLAQLGEVDHRHPVDAMLDLALLDGLETRITVPFVNVDRDAVSELVADTHTLVGLGDAGAHVNSITNFTYPTYVLASLVRDEQRLTLAAAVAEMTSRPAAVLGIPGRGTLAVGAAADVCVIDLERLDIGAVEVTADLPGGATRLVQRATGYRTVLVNGQVVLLDDELTGTRPGTLIRATS
jgi:N-acyl-D-amino-acid deacylase